MANIQDTIRRIQEEAKRTVEVARFSKSKPPIPKVAVAPVAKVPTADEVVASLREQLSTAIAQALSTKAARRYIGDVTEELQDIAAEAVESVRNTTDFGGAVKAGNKVIIYPNNCKLLVQNNNGCGSFVIEEAPQYRTVFTHSEQKPQTYRIPMPYMVYLIGFQYHDGQYSHAGSGIGFGKEPIDSIDTRMLMPKLPHTTGNMHVCQPMNKANHKTVKELGEYVIQTFWSTIFHYSFELSRCQFKVNGKSIKSFADWAKIKNPLDILKGDFERGQSVQEVLGHFGQVQETRGTNTANHKIQSAVTRVVNGVNRSLSAEELSDVIRRTAEEIVNVALQNAIGDSALQH
jgi:hypothetical protein